MKTLEPREQWIDDLLASLGDDYDTEAIEMDIRHNNFSPDRVDEYRHENIVRASFVNGQFTQARNQCREYGLSYDAEHAKFKAEVQS